MKYIALFILLFACNSSEKKESDKNDSTNEDISISQSDDNYVLKKIKHKIIKNGMGMIKIKYLSDLEKINDSTFKAYHAFDNSMVNQEMRVTNIYIFNKNLDSVVSLETVKTETKSDDDWIELDLDF